MSNAQQKTDKYNLVTIVTKTLLQKRQLPKTPCMNG